MPYKALQKIAAIIIDIVRRVQHIFSKRTAAMWLKVVDQKENKNEYAGYNNLHR